MGLPGLPSRSHTLPPGRLFDLRALQRQSRRDNQAQIRSLCDNAYLGESTSLCRVLGRYKMFVDTRDVGLSTHLLLDGFWEMWLTEALSAVLKPGMVAVDIGANLGYYTLLMADLVGAAGRVHAFEPNPPIADLMWKSCDVNGFAGRVTLHRDPLGSEEGRPVALVPPSGEPKNAHVTLHLDTPGGMAMTTRRFDGYPDLMEADVVKIDAEAAEFDIWGGMAGRLDRIDKPLTIFMEFASIRYEDPDGFLADVEARGFRLAEVTLDDGVEPRTRKQILAGPPRVDQMLMLTR
jgi:FkbM family methyltransferase